MDFFAQLATRAAAEHEGAKADPEVWKFNVVLCVTN